MTGTRLDTSNHHGSPVHEPPAAIRATGIVLVLTVVLAIVALAFALPAVHTAPNNVPIGAAGPQAAGGLVSPQGRGVEAVLNEAAPGAFDITYYPGEAALRDAIHNRDVYGGMAFNADERTLLIATGGSPIVAQVLTQVSEGIAKRTGAQVHLEDLAPPTPADPRGAGLAASALPLTLAALLPAFALVLVLKREAWTRAAAMVVFSGLAGAMIAVLLRFVLGSIDQNFWGVTAGLTLGVLAAGLTILGLGSVFGRVGLVIGALLALLVGNPLSGLNSAPEMLPGGWGALGQWLPQGANATLLRSTAFFDGAGSAMAIVVLSCWVLAGATLMVIAALRQRSNG